MHRSFRRAIAIGGSLLLAMTIATRTPGAQAPASRPAATDSTAPVADGAPLMIGGTEVARIRTGLGAFTAAERAEAAARRLEALARDVTLDDIPVVVDTSEGRRDIVAADKVILAVTEADARAAGVPRERLADSIATRIRIALAESHAGFTVRGIARGVGFAVLALLLFVAVVRATGAGARWLEARLTLLRGRFLGPLRIQKLELVSAERMEQIAFGAVRVLRIAVLVVAVYALIPVVIGFLPWTRDFAERMRDAFLEPVRVLGVAFIGYLPKFFFLAVIGVVTYYAIALVRTVFHEIGRGALVVGGFDRDWAEPTFKIVRALLLAFAAVIAFPYLPGAESDAFKGISLFVGVLLSLGSSSAVANIVSGVILTYTRAFRLGDRVRIGETEGDVIATTLLVTRLRTIKQVEVTIPNALVLSSHIDNFQTAAQADGLILHTTVTIGYDVPWRQVHELLVAAARATPDIEAEPAPFVLQTSLDDSYVSYQLNAYTKAPNRKQYTHAALHARIQDAFWDAGVEILSPHYRAVRDGHHTTIPPDHLAPDYVAPAFRVTHVGPSAPPPAPPAAD